MEYSGQIDSFIDILVQSLEEHIKIFKVIKDEIVQPIRELCISPTYECQCVKLMKSILRPACVKGLWLSKNRKDQAIGMKALKQKVLYQGEFNYTHTWGERGESKCQLPFDHARSLLGESKWEQLLENHCFELQGVKHGFMKLDGTTTSTILMDQPRLKFKCSFRGLEEQIHAYNLLADQMDDGFNHLHQRQQKIIKKVEEKMEDMLKLQKTLMSKLPKNVDRILDFSIQLHQRKVPHCVFH